jgi:hypothetical protein
VTLFACSTCLMGCIIRDFDYQPPPNQPPSVHSSTQTPMNEVVLVDLDAPAGGDGGAGVQIHLIAIVRDANVNDELQAIGFVNRNPAAGMANPFRDWPILPEQDADPESRRFEFDVPRTEFTSPGCYVVELHVSRRFSCCVNPQPETDGDLGVGVWFVAAFNDASPVVDMTACPRF